MARLEAELGACSETIVVRERRIESLRAELQLAHAEAAGAARGLARVGLELEEVTVAARARATRLRLDALREAAGVAARVKAIAGADPENAERLLVALEEAVGRVAIEDAPRDRGARSTPREKPSESGTPEGGSSEGGLPEGSLADPRPTGKDLNRRAGDAEFERDARLVNVDIGPFSDFSQLIRFEDAANAIGATEEISIRRFSEGRANIEVSLSEPIDLLRELEQSCELEFEVRRAERGEIILDVGE